MEHKISRVKGYRGQYRLDCNNSTWYVLRDPDGWFATTKGKTTLHHPKRQAAINEALRIESVT